MESTESDVIFYGKWGVLCNFIVIGVMIPDSRLKLSRSRRTLWRVTSYTLNNGAYFQSLKESLKRHTGNLPQFQWSGLSEKDEIGRGANGSVFIATHGEAEKVVMKKTSSASSKKRVSFIG